MRCIEMKCHQHALDFIPQTLAEYVYTWILNVFFLLIWIHILRADTIITVLQVGILKLKKANCLPKLTQLESNRSRIWNQGCLKPEPFHCTVLPLNVVALYPTSALFQAATKDFYNSFVGILNQQPRFIWWKA